MLFLRMFGSSAEQSAIRTVLRRRWSPFKCHQAPHFLAVRRGR